MPFLHPHPKHSHQLSLTTGIVLTSNNQPSTQIRSTHLSITPRTFHKTSTNSPNRHSPNRIIPSRNKTNVRPSFRQPKRLLTLTSSTAVAHHTNTHIMSTNPSQTAHPSRPSHLLRKANQLLHLAPTTPHSKTPNTTASDPPYSSPTSTSNPCSDQQRRRVYLLPPQHAYIASCADITNRFLPMRIGQITTFLLRRDAATGKDAWFGLANAGLFQGERRKGVVFKPGAGSNVGAGGGRDGGG